MSRGEDRTLSDYLKRADCWTILDLIAAEFTSDPTSVQCFDLRVVARAVELARNGRTRSLPPTCPAALVWHAHGSRLWTGVLWIECEAAGLAEALAAAHNGVLSGLFGSEAMP